MSCHKGSHIYHGMSSKKETGYTCSSKQVYNLFGHYLEFQKGARRDIATHIEEYILKRQKHFSKQLSS